MRLSGHTVLITGGNSGIGLALARQFSKNNNRVIICGRNLERLNLAKEEMSQIEVIQCDLAQEKDIKHLVATIEQNFSNLSILINNAGVQVNYRFIHADRKQILHDLDWETQINFNAPVKLIALCLPMLRQHSESAILNISSGLALTPKASAPIYCGTKAALHMFSKSLRYQMEDDSSNIKVFEAILPLVDTAMTKGRGKGKIKPKQVADEIMQAMRKNNYEIKVGKVKLLVWLNRLIPSLAETILRNS